MDGAQSTSLPTDEEFLDQLYAAFRDDDWINMQERFNRLSDVVHEADAYIASGAFSETQRAQLTEALAEATTPSEYFRGHYVNVLREAALRLLDTERARLEAIPVACLPTRMLNAAAWPTPRGGAVIVLDQGVIFSVAFLVRSWFAYYSWYSDQPYCRDHTQAEFGRTIQHIAAFCATGDTKHLERITTVHCPSRPVHDEALEMTAFGIELFIMLHEFGHLVLGHLGASHSIQRRLEPLGNQEIYVNSVDQEFEADAFAFQRYLPSLAEPRDIAFLAGLLFHLFHLSEIISAPQEPRTHPPAIDRWLRIKEAANLLAYPETLANQLDHTFAPLAASIAEVVRGI